jgi:hypothetical protein
LLTVSINARHCFWNLAAEICFTMINPPSTSHRRSPSPANHPRPAP